MAYTALYREWRPKIFDDVVGQEHITTTLKNQIKNNRIAHAYLLCGTRGTGKTSTAKILAKAVNCLNPHDGEPCNVCDMCKKINNGTAIDVTELDAASNNGVDKIRDIIEDVQYPPQEAKYKVYIIDEVHMLSIGAVNAFLKTLEEPPANVMFILATTDAQKLPITILSRCQRFDFRRIKSEEIYKRLVKIVNDLGVYADDKSLELISRMSDGAMRDAQSILDQALSMGSGNIEYDKVINMLGLVTNDDLIRLTEAIIKKDIEASIKLISEIALSGKDIYNFNKDMITHMRNLMMVKISDSPQKILDMSAENIILLKSQSEKIRIDEIMRIIRILQEAEEQAKWSKQSRIYFELAIIKMCKIEYDTSKEVLLIRLNKLEEVIRQGNISVTCEAIIPKIVKVAIDNKEQVKLQPVKFENTDSKLTIDKVRQSWKDILETFKSRRHMIIYASLITGEIVSYGEGVVNIKYGKDFSFNKLRLEKEENKATVESIFSEILGERVGVKYLLEEEEKHKKSNEEVIIDTFGKGNVEILDE